MFGYPSFGWADEGRDDGHRALATEARTRTVRAGIPREGLAMIGTNRVSLGKILAFAAVVEAGTGVAWDATWPNSWNRVGC